MILPFPAKPWRLFHKWGVYNPIYLRFGFDRHNGVDYGISWDGKVRAELPCEVIEVGNKPDGAGKYVSILSLEPQDFPDGKYHVRIDYMHLASNFGMYVGKKLEIGEEIAPQNNSGFSTGPHTHGQYRRFVKGPNNLLPVDKNGANNSFDPEPFRDGTYAEDILRAKLEKQVQGLKDIIAQFLSLKVKQLQQQIDWLIKHNSTPR